MRKDIHCIQRSVHNDKYNFKSDMFNYFWEVSNPWGDIAHHWTGCTTKNIQGNFFVDDTSNNFDTEDRTYNYLPKKLGKSWFFFLFGKTIFSIKNWNLRWAIQKALWDTYDPQVVVCPCLIKVNVTNKYFMKKNPLLFIKCLLRMIWGSLNKFPDFFCMGTFIDSTHMKL